MPTTVIRYKLLCNKPTGDTCYSTLDTRGTKSQSSSHCPKFNMKEEKPSQCTEVRFASLLSGGFTTMAVINPPEKKLANRTSVHWLSQGPNK